ncbi:unnamed protein product, partial [Didymodactylos carnosus]
MVVHGCAPMPNFLGIGAQK